MLATMIFTFAATDGLAQTDADLKTIGICANNFTERQKDFAVHANSFPQGSSETPIAMRLYHIAENCADTADVLSDEFYIARLISDSTAKQSVREVIGRRIKIMLKRTGTIPLEINTQISATKLPAMVAEAKHLKDDLRQFREALETLSTQFPPTAGKTPLPSTAR